MKIIKRNGQEVVFDNSKIQMAIEKANASIDDTSKRLTEKQINFITNEVTNECN